MIFKFYAPEESLLSTQDLTECLGASQYGYWSSPGYCRLYSRENQRGMPSTIIVLGTTVKKTSDHLTSAATVINNFRGNYWQYIIFLGRALLLWPTSRWCTASVGILAISLFGRAVHQAAQAHFVTFSQGTAVSCLLSAQRRANGDEMGYVSAVLRLEPWTSFLLFFESFPVPFSFLFPWHPWCRSRVQVSVRLQLSGLYTRTALPKGNWEILAGLHQSGKGRCSSSGPKWEEGSCLEEWHVCARKTLPYMSYQGLTCIKSRGWVSLSRAASREREQSFTRAEDILGSSEQSWRLRLLQR